VGYNIDVILSAWRMHKKRKNIKVRDLKPVKDVKGGGGVTGESKPTTGGTASAGTTGSY
jgi:hypothetical protein